MKAVMISIRKEHNGKIFDGIKRFEGRKTLPAIILLGNYIDNTTTYNPSEYDVICYVYEPKTGGGCGKVVGQFICDFAQTFRTKSANMRMVSNALCVSEDFAKQYFNREKGYMLRVCVPQRYEKPKELSEFVGLRKTKFGCEPIKITRPPQSWCYVEERSNR